MLACLAAAVLFGAQTAHAQDPSTLSPSVQKSTSFPKQSLVGPSRNIDKSQPLYLQGDELVYDTGGNRVVARGNVEIYYNNYILTADQVVYDQSANTLTAVGNVVLKEPNGNIVRADRYTLTDDFRDGFVQSLSIVATDDTRIAAERAVRRGGNTTVFTNGRFTPCKTNDGMPPLWCISAATVIHDQQAATITYQDAQFELFGVPVLYAPYFEHADPSVKRKSGFLMPEFAGSDALGYGMSVPYYFALAPNYDFTFNPLYLSRQGILWQGEWRHRLGERPVLHQACRHRSGREQPALGLSSNRDDYDGFRGSIETKGLFSLASWWHFGWDVTAATRRHLPPLLQARQHPCDRRGRPGVPQRHLGAQLFRARGRLLHQPAVHQQWAGRRASKSYAHPMLDYNYVVADPWLGGEFRWNTNALSFSSNQDATALVPYRRHRADEPRRHRDRLAQALHRPDRPHLHALRAAARRHLPVERLRRSAGSQWAPLQNTSLARGMALAGVTVSYPWVANASYGSHVIEPIGQIIARQASIEQNTLPDEDAKSLVFDDTNLFDINKFSGYDRIETGTRANVGLQYTFQANYGGYARILAGESFQLAGDEPLQGSGRRRQRQPGVHARTAACRRTAPITCSAPTCSRSTVVQLISQSRFNWHSFALQREDAGAQLTIGPFTRLDGLLLPHHPIRPTASTAAAGHLGQSASRSPTAGALRPPCATTSTPTSSLPTWSRCATPTSASCSLRRIRTTSTTTRPSSTGRRSWFASS